MAACGSTGPREAGVRQVGACKRGGQRMHRSTPPHACQQLQGSHQGLDLDSIRSSLIRQEDTIIFNFIERAQFARNSCMYEPGGLPVPHTGAGGQAKHDSLLQYLLRETEQLHAKLRRYSSPDEHPFFDVQSPQEVPLTSYPSVLAPWAETINVNDKVMRVYLTDVLPGITMPGNDGNHGSAGVLDIVCLQALSKRIHYGKFVAEAKFRSHTAEYSQLIQVQDADGIQALLTDKAVEKKVLERVRLKSATFGQDVTAASGGDDGALATAAHSGIADVSKHSLPRLKIDPDLVAKVYEDWVMPLTKEVEVLYLLQRLGPVA